jgi:hypothetical protein
MKPQMDADERRFMPCACGGGSYLRLSAFICGKTK